ncbi:MAG: GNAT family N-acetyltransferase [Chloroflexota bacterium]
MIEVVREHFGLVLPLLATAKQPVAPQSVCLGYNPGRVFVDRGESPACAWVWLACGYLYLVGEPPQDNPAWQCLLLEELAPAWQAAGESGFILAPFSDAWQARLGDFLQSQPHEQIYRRTFTFHPERFAALRARLPRLPEGFELQRMNAALVEQLGGMPTWASTQDFIERGLGFCLVKDGEIASACTSVFATPNGVEIDVHTEEPYRRQGLATLAAAALIEACLQSGRQPNWECFWENQASCALAARLGYEMKEDYPVYYWEPA